MKSSPSTNKLVSIIKQYGDHPIDLPSSQAFTVVSGAANSGKSTIVGIIMNLNIKSFKKNGLGGIIEFEGAPNLKISDGVRPSATTLQSYTCEGNAIFELPSIQNNLRPDQDFINCVICSNLFQTDHYIKEVLVFQFCEITDNKGSSFIQSITNLIERYGIETLTYMAQSILIVINKVHLKDTAPAEIYEHLEATSKSSGPIPQIYELVRYLIMENKILIIPVVSAPELPQYCEKLRQTLARNQHYQLQCDFPLIPSSEIQLQLKQELISKRNSLQKLTQSIVNQIKSRFNRKGHSLIKSDLSKLREVLSLVQTGQIQQNKARLAEILELNRSAGIGQFLSQAQQIQQLCRFIKGEPVEFPETQQIISAVQFCIREYQAQLDIENVKKQGYDRMERSEKETFRRQMSNIGYQKPDIIIPEREPPINYPSQFPPTKFINITPPPIGYHQRFIPQQQQQHSSHPCGFFTKCWNKLFGNPKPPKKRTHIPFPSNQSAFVSPLIRDADLERYSNLSERDPETLKQHISELGNILVRQEQKLAYMRSQARHLS